MRLLDRLRRVCGVKRHMALVGSLLRACTSARACYMSHTASQISRIRNARWVLATSALRHKHATETRTELRLDRTPAAGDLGNVQLHRHAHHACSGIPLTFSRTRVRIDLSYTAYVGLWFSMTFSSIHLSTSTPSLVKTGSR